jgi:hypothetical protein
VSFQSEVSTGGEFATNACRYATALEAEQAGHELASRWFAVREWRVAESTDAVNYRFDPVAYRSVPLERIK